SMKQTRVSIGGMAVVFISNKAGAVLEMRSQHILVSMRRRSRAITLRNRLFSAKRPSYAEWPSAATAEFQRWRLVRTTARRGRKWRSRSQAQRFPGVSGDISGHRER